MGNDLYLQIVCPRSLNQAIVKYLGKDATEEWLKILKGPGTLEGALLYQFLSMLDDLIKKELIQLAGLACVMVVGRKVCNEAGCPEMHERMLPVMVLKVSRWKSS